MKSFTKFRSRLREVFVYKILFSTFQTYFIFCFEIIWVSFRLSSLYHCMSVAKTSLAARERYASTPDATGAMR